MIVLWSPSNSCGYRRPVYFSHMLQDPRVVSPIDYGIGGGKAKARLAPSPSSKSVARDCDPMLDQSMLFARTTNTTTSSKQQL